MKGSLKSRNTGQVFPFSKKLTTIGKDGCDIRLQGSVVEKEHAVIEMDETVGTFSIRDLNTPHGTYVNDCRVQNSAVKIASGDFVRFGHDGPLFDVLIDTSAFYCPPIYSQHAWTSTDVQGDKSAVGTQFPYLPSRMSADAIALAESGVTSLPTSMPIQYSSRYLDQPVSAGVMPHPPARSRHYGDARDGNKHRPHSAIHTSGELNVSFMGGIQSNTEDRIHDMEQKLLKMGDELSRLASFEAECYRKDGVIVSLRNEIADLRCKLPGSQVDGTFSFTPRIISNVADILQSDNQFLKGLLNEKEENERQNIQRFAHLQSQLSTKDKTITKLEEELDKLKLWTGENVVCERHTEKIASLQSEISRKEQIIFSLQNDLEKARKQKTQSSNLVNTLQRESSAKDNIINKVRSETEKLKKEIREKESHISALSTKLAKQTALKDLEAESQKKLEEIVSLKQKIRHLENDVREKVKVIQNLQDELQLTRAQMASGQKNDRALQQELHQTRNQFVDVERSERSLKIELREWQNKFEKFRQRLIQTVYRLGLPMPNKELDEDDLLKQIRLICEERVDLQQKTQELMEQMDKGAAAGEDLDKWKRKIQKALGRLEKKLLKHGRRCVVLEDEAAYFKEMEVPEGWNWVKEAISSMLVQEHRWQQDLEEALEDLGFSREEQGKEPGNLIQEIKDKLTEKAEELEGLQKRLSNATQSHEDEITKLRTKLIEEAQENASDSIAVIRREEEEKREKLVEKFEKRKREAIEEAVEAERRAFQREYGDLIELKKRCKENQREADECRAQMIILEQKTTQLQAALDQIQHKEVASQKELENQETHHRVQLESIEKDRQEYREKVQEEIQTFKEQARQHSLTIVALEERVLKMNKEKKHLELESMRYKEYGPDYYGGREEATPRGRMNARPASSVPKRDVAVATVGIVDGDWQLREQCHKLEQLLEMLRKEMAKLETENKQKEDVITRLRKELNMATARLSDMTGELDDLQKQKVEELQMKLQQHDEQMREQRGQLLKLSSLVEEQKGEILKREKALSKHQEMLVKQKEEIDSRNEEILHMRATHDAERDGLDDEMSRLAEEQLQTRDLKSAGARCIGEKHDDVIKRQKVALADLRASMKGQGVLVPIATTQEAALSQIGALKKEVADLRYQLATRDQDFYKSDSELHAEARASRELLYSASQEVNVEKKAHKETVAALDASEQSYLSLLRAVMDLLEMRSVPGLHPIAHAPVSEIPRLLREREEGLKEVTKAIHNLHERLARKEQLLHGYEEDLSSLRKTESLVDQKSAEALSLASNVRTQKDEIAYLRESLSRVREELDQQKRLNKSTKERKIFMMDYDDREKKKSSHSCAQEDEKRYKEEMKKKKQMEKMKRKNYEIASLKRELHHADKELNETAAKLHAIGRGSFRSQFEKDLATDS